ncbi:MAG: glycosyltransferase family 2 protein [Candidatus Zixiibacteriota bacterium]
MTASRSAERVDTLSVIIITKNEERNIQECLESVAWAGEIVLADSGSTDRTVEIAERHGARVKRVEWEGFGLTKQRALESVSGEWALSIDADERVTAELAREIREAITRQDAAGYEIPRLTNFVGRWIRHSGWYPDPVLRLFRRERGRFSPAAVHESVILSGNCKRLKNHLLHYSYRSLEDYIARMNRYTSLAARELFEKEAPFSYWQPLLKPLAVATKRYFLKLGFLDGWAGAQIAILSAVYVFLKYAKLRQLERDPSLAASIR